MLCEARGRALLHDDEGELGHVLAAALELALADDGLDLDALHRLELVVRHAVPIEEDAPRRGSVQSVERA